MDKSTASNPTGANEKSVAKVPGSEPWKTGEAAKFKYHPYGDKNSDPKDAPSPLRVSIIPDVNLPKVCWPIDVRFCGQVLTHAGIAREVQQIRKGRISLNNQCINLIDPFH